MARKVLIPEKTYQALREVVAKAGPAARAPRCGACASFTGSRCLHTGEPVKAQTRKRCYLFEESE